MIYFLTFLLVIGVLAAVGYGVVHLVTVRRSDAAVQNKGLKAQLKSERHKVAVASKALRNIASGTSGLPVLDASNALDELEQIEIKELN